MHMPQDTSQRFAHVHSCSAYMSLLLHLKGAMSNVCIINLLLLYRCLF